ncbi:hypothetical protein BRL53_05160 [Corynebacterium ulcerans]|uniref:hypothetical protein n=1 Tax=Corynebacterium ulcerans TaxID=65058 RepID=UPI000C791339|nr:hypothetical protein [Corynebacterium ulcerans]PLW00123.1 hypothetical protein BRL53_05160 [Corynebacterium ulcerans]
MSSAKHSKRATSRLTKAVIATATISTIFVATPASAIDVVSQPGTQRPAPPRPAPPTPAAVPAPVVNFVPGAQRAVQPIIVRNVVTNEIVYETSPGLALASPHGAAVLNPGNVLATFERNVRPEDRAAMDAARGAAAAGAVVGGIAGAAGGALATGAAGAGLAAGAGAAICGAASAAIPIAPPVVAPFAGACWAAGPAFIGPVVGGAIGAGVGVPIGATAGMIGGVQAGAALVPGGQAVMQRAIADTTWELESQARVAQGAEPLAGQRPGDHMAATPAPATPGSAEHIVSQVQHDFDRAIADARNFLNL